MAPKIAIRADGNGEIGFGHLMRMQALAYQFKKRGAKAVFLTRTPENIKNYEKIGIPDSYDFHKEDEHLMNFLQSSKTDLLIVDNYKYDQERLDNIAGLDIISVYIDDLNLYEFNVDFVVNGNLYAPRLNYRGRARFLLGSKYLMLREEFMNVCPREVSREVKNILLTFGAADVNNLILKVLDYVQEYRNFATLNWKVVIGPAFSTKKEIEKKVKNHSNIHLYYNPDIKNLMDNCDISISAAGSTTYELAACGVPTILIVVADNQTNLAQEADLQGIAINLGWYQDVQKNDLFNALDSLIYNYDSRKNMAAKGQKMVDGLGARRIVDILLRIVGGDRFARDNKW